MTKPLFISMKPNDYLINCYTSNGNRFNITCQQQTVHHHNIMYSVKLLCLHTFKGMYRNRNFKMKDVILTLIGTESKTLAYKVLEKIIGSKPKVLILGTELLAWNSSPDVGQRPRGVTPNSKYNSISTNYQFVNQYF